MKHITKKLALRTETVRSLDHTNLIAVAGARYPLTRTACADGACPTGNTTGGGGDPSGNICLATELTCYYC